MRGGALWAVAFTLDPEATVLVLGGNLLFAFALARWLFRGRAPLDRALIALGLFFAVTASSAAGMYLWARTPIRELQVFAVD